MGRIMVSASGKKTYDENSERKRFSWCVCEKESQQANENSKDRLGYCVGPLRDRERPRKERRRERNVNLDERREIKSCTNTIGKNQLIIRSISFITKHNSNWL